MDKQPNNRLLWRAIIISPLLIWAACNPLRKMDGEEALFRRAQVKTQTVYGIGDSPDNDPAAGRLISISDYDPRGRITHHARLSPVTTDTFHTDYQYNNQGKISLITYRFDGEATPVAHEYDAKGRLIRVAEAGAEARDYHYQYNNKGQRVLELGKAAYPNDDDGVDWVTQDSTVYDYAPSGKMNRKRYFMFGDMYNDTRFFYNEKGWLVKEEEYREDGTVARRSTYTYDRKGLPILIKVENLSEETEEYRSLVYGFY